ncbi:MAG: Secretory immunoglobulin A-binding protein EsiB [Nitrosomonadaceae bacterium]|nr:Secretory immunoglobulin A-binding protein EsiB [Nitrosomonadaceae bacterium]
MYRYGHGIPQDHVEAVRLYLKAADQGHAPAQYTLGNMYDDGLGVTQDKPQMLHWYRKAADQGHVIAQYELGSRAKGAEAVKWYRKAADQGHPNSQGQLLIMYLSGDGVARDLVQAYKWDALGGGDANGFIRRDSDAFFAKHMTPSQIAEAQKLVREWMPSLGR